MQPIEYASAERQKAIEQLLSRVNRSTNDSGLYAVYENGIIYTRIKDADTFRKRLVDAGFDTGWAERELEMHMRGEANFNLSDLEDWWTTVARHVISKVPPRYIERLSSVPVFVSASTSLNAWAEPVGNGDVIAVNSGVEMLWIWLTSHYVMMDLFEDNDPKRPYRAILSGMPWFASQAMNGTWDSARFANPGFPVWARDEIVRLMHDTNSNNAKRMGCVDEFVMAHELGHIALGHTDVVRKWNSSPGPKERKRQCSEMCAFEFEADEFATQILMSSQPLKARQFRDPLFSLFLMFHVDECVTPKDSPRTHPFPTERCQRVFTSIGVEKAECDPSHLMVAMYEDMVKAKENPVAI